MTKSIQECDKLGQKIAHTHNPALLRKYFRIIKHYTDVTFARVLHGAMKCKEGSLAGAFGQVALYEHDMQVEPNTFHAEMLGKSYGSLALKLKLSDPETIAFVLKSVPRSLPKGLWNCLLFHAAEEFRPARLTVKIALACAARMSILAVPGQESEILESTKKSLLSDKEYLKKCLADLGKEDAKKIEKALANFKKATRSKPIFIMNPPTKRMIEYWETGLTS